ncbi:MAG: mechanosensitive ion channel family protein [Candidatus Moranbacteria bacterium]|jgi:small-conductance mechanosensitive channel|nr:mechanosensitive ion channel family protein [Candidatus Moranbacteria bacterium]MBP9801840.1 mechanosensitive ion channel family protein [Candidatus Moranbacteria bacterium]
MTSMEFFSGWFSASYWQCTYFGNTLERYALGGVLFLIGFVCFGVLQKVILYRLEKLAEKTKTNVDDIFIRIVRSFRPPFYSFLAFYIAAHSLELAPWVGNAVTSLLIAWITYRVIGAVQIVIDFIVEKQIKSEGNRNAEAAFHNLSLIGKVLLWSLGLLLILSNFGVNITSLIAGLGIGGVAIAFALQNILGDLFSSFAIYFDKPFEIGDFIIVGDHLGTVEKIGIKSTRLRSLDGEELVISNAELTSARIRNFKKMQTRRIAFGFGIVYETPSKTLREIPALIKKIVEGVKETTFDRAHFKSFGDSSLDFEVVYLIASSDYNRYMDIQQDINFQLKEALESRGVAFAYPTQKLYLSKDI